MFPRNKVDFLYRMLCLIAFLLVIIFIYSSTTVTIIALAFYVLTIFEKRFENIFLYIVTGIVFILCLTMGSYILLRIITVIDYLHYFLNTDTLDDFDDLEDISYEVKRDEHYIRFENKKIKKIERKDNNRLCTIFVVVHMVLLLLAIVVG